MMFADAKHIEADFVSERDCFEQLAQMSRRIDGPARRVNGCRYETVYADLHRDLFGLLKLKSPERLQRASPRDELIQHVVDRRLFS